MPLDPHARESMELQIKAIEAELATLRHDLPPGYVNRSVELQLKLGELIRHIAAAATPESGQPCPACEYPLQFLAWSDGAPSDEPCPRCGILFGYDDAADGDLKKRDLIYVRWRDRWIAAGSPYLFPRIPD